jgi:SAM-dependent methyltransferase
MSSAERDFARHFYSRVNWAEWDWVDLISVEYEELLSIYPFSKMLTSLARDDGVRLLDVGCGTGIFPRFLDPYLDENLRIQTDLLDLSPLSLERCQAVLEGLRHFRVGQSFPIEIESIPRALLPDEHRYDVIWAVHSLTTVELPRMPEVLAHLIQLLAQGGRLLIYQLALASTYQRLHSHYRQHHRVGRKVERFMQAEDTVEILKGLGHQPHVSPLSFEHHVPSNDETVLQHYLRKCVLDETLDAIRLFEPLLESFLDKESMAYRFPQTVHLIEVGVG